MKYKQFLLALLSLAIIMTLTACGEGKNVPVVPAPVNTISEPAQSLSDTVSEPQTLPEPAEDQTDYLSIYAEVLDRYYYLIAINSDDFGEGEMGVFEAIIGKEKDEALKAIGYAIEDISGDNIPELLIGSIKERKNSQFFGSETYAVFTCMNDLPHFIFEGSSRNSYHYSGEGKFYHWGSSGANYTQFGTYSLSPDGAELICNDFYFTFEKDASSQEIGFYHNTTGETNSAVSEELFLSDEAFWQITADFKKEIHNIELIPFSMYHYKGEDIQTAAANVTLHRAEDVLDSFTAYDEFIADETEPRTGVVFIADTALTDFRVLSLALDGTDSNGAAAFSTEVLYTLDTLAPEHPLVVYMTFYGSIPYYGISYRDPHGIKRAFSVNISGEDGSLYLVEF